MRSPEKVMNLNMKKPQLILIIAAAVILRIAVILIFRTYAHPVGWEYEDIANNLLSGKGYMYVFLNTPYMSFNAPLFGLLCAGVYTVTHHNYLAVLLIQTAFSALLILTVFGIARRIFGDGVALLAAALTAIHPGFIYYDTFNLLPFSIDSFLIAAATLFFLKIKDNPTPLKMSLLGGLIALGVYSRGIIGALLPFLAAYFILLVRSVDLKRRLKLVILLVAATFIVLSPWIIRNYIIHKEFVFMVSTSAENLWRGNNEYATGTSYNKDKKSIFELVPNEFRNKVFAMKEIEQKKLFEKEAWSFIKAHPADVLRLYVKKIYYFWWFSPQSGIIYPKAFLAAYKALYTGILLFSIIGLTMTLLFASSSIKYDAILLVFVLMSICLTQSIFYVEGRHRWLIEPIILIFFSYGVIETYKYLLCSLKRS